MTLYRQSSTILIDGHRKLNTEDLPQWIFPITGLSLMVSSIYLRSHPICCPPFALTMTRHSGRRNYSKYSMDTNPPRVYRHLRPQRLIRYNETHTVDFAIPISIAMSLPLRSYFFSPLNPRTKDSKHLFWSFFAIVLRIPRSGETRLAAEHSQC